jgi:hypothetical protein
MLDFRAYREKEISFDQLIAGVTRAGLADLTSEMIDDILGRIQDCLDGEVTFRPEDPEAYDPYALHPKEIRLPWTLGHVIVHVTASSEESAALAAEMARGVANHGRSRYEVPWREMRTVEACRHRLEESRRMRRASLGMWPEEPHLEVEYAPWDGAPRVNAIGRFVLGLSHAESHLHQIDDIIRQARAAGGNRR